MKRFLAALVGAFIMAPGAAQAEPVTETFRVGPMDVSGYEVKVNELQSGIPHPQVDGHVTHMEVDLVDEAGKPVPIERLMLHHIVFLHPGVRDATCGDGFTAFNDMTRFPNLAERFYAAGEERMELALPKGYGYPVKPDDSWALTAMVMNHRLQADRAWIQYKVTYDTDPSIKPVKPIWMDVENCRADPVYDVPGGKKRGTNHLRTATWTAPEGGRIVAGGGHVHGGGKSLRLSQPGCGNRELFSSDPLWGNPDHPFYRVKPVLHEPGPVSMTGTITEQGFPVAAGEQVQLTSVYDAARPHTRVMGILVNFFAPDASVDEPCGALPTDALTAQVHPQPGRTKTPKVKVPLTGLDERGRAVRIKAPPGKLRREGRRAKVNVVDFGFSKPNIKVRKGAKVRWVFKPRTLHNVTLASGPRGFSSKNLSDGRRYVKKLRRKGTYRLFCGLHPVSMTQRIVVR